MTKLKTVKRVHRARREDVGDLVTYQALPVPSLGVEGLEPFLLLNHHGPQVYPPRNRGLPFGPHPHRGFETVTFILDGDLVHRDTGGYESRIGAGGVQWMTAGRGLIHAEVSSDEFKARGGPLEILQLWLNLPARLKMTEPRYSGLQKDDIPVVKLDDARVELNLVAGLCEGTAGPFETLTDVTLCGVLLKRGGRFAHDVAAGRRILFYVVRGRVEVNGVAASALDLVEFGAEGERVEAEAREDSLILFGHAAPNNEPVAARGPFVMNTDREIEQAMRDYAEGKFGVWRYR